MYDANRNQKEKVAPMTDNATLLVTGAGGKLGRLVVERLLAQGRKVIAASRDTARLADLAARGAELRRADFDDPASLAAAFAGVDRVLLVSTDELARPGRRLAQHTAAVKAAAEAGVKHVVYTSMPNPEPGSPIPFAPDHYGTEQALAASPLGWTVLRNSWYAENLLLGTLQHAAATGQWYSAAGDGKVNYVTRADCAAAAAGALANPPAGNTILTVTGPEALTTAEIVAKVAAVAGKPVAVVPVEEAAIAAGLKAAGLPDPYPAVLATFDTNTRIGKADVLTDAVEQLSGVRPQSLDAFLVANRAAFAG